MTCTVARMACCVLLSARQATLFLQLSVAAIAYFGHPVFEVLEWELVPGTAPADDLSPGGHTNE